MSEFIYIDMYGRRATKRASKAFGRIMCAPVGFSRNCDSENFLRKNCPLRKFLKKNESHSEIFLRKFLTLRKFLKKNESHRLRAVVFED